MSKRKISSHFGGKRNEETEKDKDQDNLRVEEAEGDGNTNPKVVKMTNESRNFQAKWLKEHTRLRYKNQAMFCHFCSLGKKKYPFTGDKGCSNFKTTTLTRHVSSREHQDATIVKPAVILCKKKSQLYNFIYMRVVYTSTFSGDN